VWGRLGILKRIHPELKRSQIDQALRHTVRPAFKHTLTNPVAVQLRTTKRTAITVTQQWRWHKVLLCSQPHLLFMLIHLPFLCCKTSKASKDYDKRKTDTELMDLAPAALVKLNSEKLMGDVSKLTIKEICALHLVSLAHCTRQRRCSSPAWRDASVRNQVFSLRLPVHLLQL
jgi:hypothetical protein